MKLSRRPARPNRRKPRSWPTTCSRSKATWSALIEGYSPARGEGDDEEPARSICRKLPRNVAAGARAQRNGGDVEVAWQGDMNVEARARHQALLTNLVSNALRHGSSVRRPRKARMRGRTSVEITIDDDGPGIPPDKYEDALELRPFLPASTNRWINGLKPHRHRRPSASGGHHRAATCASTEPRKALDRPTPGRPAVEEEEFVARR